MVWWKVSVQRGFFALLWWLLLSADCGRCSQRNSPSHSPATLNFTVKQAAAKKPEVRDRKPLDNFVDTGAPGEDTDVADNRRPHDVRTLVEDMEGVQFHPAQLVKYTQSANATALPPTSSAVTSALTVPVVVSLLHYDDVKGHLGQPAPAGYPVVCVPPCDPHHPGFATLGASCKESTRSGPPSTLQYTWDAAATDDDGSITFEPISRETPFASVQQRVLDSMYLPGGSTVRCIVEETRGAFGHRRTFSDPVVISPKGICPADKQQVQDVTASMEYLNGTGPSAQPDRLRITVHLKHRDSMLPLVSTHPLPSAEQLFGNVVSQKQHVCSNVAGRGDHDLAFAAFMNSAAGDPGTGEARPYQNDPAIRGSPTVALYRHLDLDRCLWTFEAAISLKDAVGVCGGVLLEDFKEPDSHRRFVTARLPLYVTLAFPVVGAAFGEAAPRWTSVERRSQLELSFAYGPALWSERPLGTRATPKAKVSVTRVSLSRDGRLSVHLLSKALFHGMLALSHTTKKDVRGRFSKPASGDSGHYSLTLLWAEPSFDAPSQLWKAVSEHSFKDYSGLHELELVPCVAAPTQEYKIPPEDFCTSLDPLRFQVSVLAPQPINALDGAVYNMGTELQLLSSREEFLSDPRDLPHGFGDVDERRIFFRGETLFGRVLWKPLEDLSASLRIDQVYLCTGKAGFTPSFDPTGHELARAPSFGCVQPSPDLEHRFLILDRSNPDHVHDSVAGVPFKAKLAEQDSLTSRLRDYPGVDGFSMLVDPLYETASGGQWYLQVLYSVVPHGRGGHRRRRGMTVTSPSNETATATEMHSFRIGGKSAGAASTVLAAGSSALSVLLLGGWAAYRHRRAVVASSAATSTGARNGGRYAALCGHHHHHSHCHHYNVSSLCMQGARVVAWPPVLDTVRPDTTEV
ncbi:extracellular matrix organizing protein FRAS1-like isoform X1 [Dermacentor andersoni]|uniref:extracellular matrix organizing protein FRAS1-like isoform X1 n=1 Tax=Dermacentor andersoni TaxID=34620 RepID=UPI002155889C|nr:extracellular matrix organizing protein FRAS1-like isoform X1 [Dermacentor andersoni]